jgi:pyruvate, water dikinase
MFVLYARLLRNAARLHGEHSKEHPPDHNNAPIGPTMNFSSEQSIDDLLYVLGERAKELNCIYKIEELLGKTDSTLENIFRGVISTIPTGMQYHSICQARIRYGNEVFEPENVARSYYTLVANIIVQDRVEGTIEVYYTQSLTKAEGGPFLKEEHKLVNAIAERLSNFILHRRLRGVFNEWQNLKQELSDRKKAEWQVVIEMLHRTDQNLFTRISRKMLNHLCRLGIPEANELLERFGETTNAERDDIDMNVPQQREELHRFINSSDEIFRIAEKRLQDEETLTFVQKWIQDDKSGFLLTTLENLDSSINEVADAIGKYHHMFPVGVAMSRATAEVIRVSLIRRFFSDDLSYINLAKQYFEISDFYELAQRVINHQKSHGKLGGKSAGLFLADRILRKCSAENELLKGIKVPRTWYISSDCVSHFIHYNNLEEVFNQKYYEIDQIREEYPHIVQLFKNSYFSPEIVKGLSMALDDLGDNPIIVRSSSLLEDNTQAAFAGKYKSLFLANTGSKSKRLEAVMDAIAEVFASLFGPDPIEYRAERGLLDFHEEMGVMIQEVVGKRVGKYFFPAFAGVAFSNNEFRWSPRIRREDGLIRMVPGLGTRAVDRLSDDFPTLLAPGQPNLRVNVTTEEMVRYSPKKIDVIDLEAGKFLSLDIPELLRECGDQYPGIDKIVSMVEDDHLRNPVGIFMDFERSRFAVTFNGVIERTKFIPQLYAVMKTLQETYHSPIDIEFATDGDSIFLLQCRTQSFSSESTPAPIPRDIPRDRLVFTANRFVSNGRIPEVTHIVYVDPQEYSELPERSDLHSVGRAIGRLNNILPRRRFILIGPGRWGSRGDIRLGVNVTYSDINNTAMLVEVARKKGNYIPDLSFGTHFFQDLVEASIRYLPLYPDDDGVVFNETFLTHAQNTFAELLPEFKHLQHVIKVIDVAEDTGGMICTILQNAELDEAVAFFTLPGAIQQYQTSLTGVPLHHSEDHWSWRVRMAERIAANVDAQRFGVKAMYVIGSAKNATAGPKSDIDLLIHHEASEEQTQCLSLWLDGWNQCLCEINFSRTGYRVEQMLDAHFITDDDIEKKSSFAVKINAVSDGARQLPMKKKKSP